MSQFRRFPTRSGTYFAGLRLAFWIFIFATGIAPCLAQRPLGIDVSTNDGAGTINWVTTKSGGVSFAWTKATEGLTYNDESFLVNEANAKSAGVLIGAYHYAHPETHVGLAGADVEAGHFWSVASNYIKGAGIYMMPMLDLESDLSSASPAYTSATLSAWVNEWCQDIVNFAASNGVTVKPIVYTYTSYANGSSGVAPALNSSVTGWPLWMAQYPASPDPQNGAPSSTYPWPTWNFWQYYGASSGSATVHDLDVFNGVYTNLDPFVIGGLTKPFIQAQSINSLAIDAGSNASFTATVGGAGTLALQWKLNGTSFPGATNATILITNAQASQSGLYTLVVTNSSGSVTSSPLSLIVYPPQAVVFSDNFDSNTAANWTINRSSPDTAVAFNYDYHTALGIVSAPHSTNGTTRGLQMKANLTLTNVAAVSLSPVGQSFAGDYRLHFDGWINVNGPFPGGGASSTEFLIAGIGTAGNRAEWTGSGSTADGYYFTADGDGGVSPSSTTFGDYSGYIGTTWETAASGIYPAGSVDNTATYYTNVYPTGKAAPVLQQTTYSQQTGSLAVGTIGLGWHDFIVSRRGTTVNWSVDGVQFATISNASFTASNICVGFWDPFASLTDNTNLSFGLVDNLRVEVPSVAPVITLQPLPQTVILGTNVTFTASATGLPSPAYQWRFNGANIVGATSSNYVIASVATNNAGIYSVIVSNNAGFVTSSNATLALVAPHAAQFAGINVQANDTLQLNFTGDAYWSYTIQTSTNLLTGPWNNLTNLVSASGNFSLNVGSVTNAPQLFYRAVVSY